MDPQVQASFIPKRSLDVNASRGSSFGLFFLIALLVFVASLVAAGGVFLYKSFLTNTLEGQKQSLNAAQGAYDPATIADLSRLDKRIKEAQTLLEKHLAITTVFAFLSTQTLERVAYGNFGIEVQTDGSAKITMSGEADSFATVALQSDQLGGNKLLKDVIFSGIAVNQFGKVNFQVSAVVDPSLLSYAQSLEPAATQ